MPTLCFIQEYSKGQTSLSQKVCISAILTVSTVSKLMALQSFTTWITYVQYQSFTLCQFRQTSFLIWDPRPLAKVTKLNSQVPCWSKSKQNSQVSRLTGLTTCGTDTSPSSQWLVPWEHVERSIQFTTWGSFSPRKTIHEKTAFLNKHLESTKNISNSFSLSNLNACND